MRNRRKQRRIERGYEGARVMIGGKRIYGFDSIAVKYKEMSETANMGASS